MEKIFWGLCIAWIHFNLNLNSLSFELFPAFLGWYFVLQGANELPDCFERTQLENPLKMLISFSAIEWFLNILGGGIFGKTIGLMTTCVEIYAIYLLINLVDAVGKIVSHQMPVENLRLLWKVNVTCTVAALVIQTMQSLWWNLGLQGLFTLSLSLISFFSLVFTLYNFWQAHKAYEEAMAHPIEFLPPEE